MGLEYLEDIWEAYPNKGPTDLTTPLTIHVNHRTLAESSISHRRRSPNERNRRRGNNAKIAKATQPGANNGRISGSRKIGQASAITRKLAVKSAAIRQQCIHPLGVLRLRSLIEQRMLQFRVSRGVVYCAVPGDLKSPLQQSYLAFIYDCCLFSLIAEYGLVAKEKERLKGQR